MAFEIVGDIEQVETIATGSRVKNRALLRKICGHGRWRKRKGLALGVETARSSIRRRRIMKRLTKEFAVCLKNDGYEASLILGKVYRVIPDARASKDNLVRIIDESGDDYLFGTEQFAFVEFPQAVRRKLLALAKAS